MNAQQYHLTGRVLVYPGNALVQHVLIRVCTEMSVFECFRHEPGDCGRRSQSTEEV